MAGTTGHFVLFGLPGGGRKMPEVPIF